ncbi:YcaO-like family protein [Streptomyces pseudovenezuelae]|uniref:Ribosomal protein S12 methylthiotransferase accessory factor n=1 Tax=Streptomyces pseudovenezuelae TaxID=67350 RepID=A0ABT6M1V1_9ACTN|nr:YcaO-like family protein [Streptomyces pseudovenezuelae]MDH6222533.1 ribosomal protein S12 methylthiotransferase accessory factor [Streptomyces pseudovenezuelae]
MPNDVLENLGRLISPYGVAGEVRELTYAPGEPTVPAYGTLAGQVLGLLDADPLNRAGAAARTRGSKVGASEDFTAAGTAGTPERARLLALAEMLERYCATMAQDPDVVIRASAEELGDAALDLSSLPRLSAEEFARPGQPLLPPDPTAPIRWVRGWSLTRRCPVYVPAVVAWMGCPPQRPAERIWHPISTGFAVHGDLRTAVTHALCECVERDMISTVWLRRLPLPQLDISRMSELGEPAREMLARYRRSVLADPVVFDATSDLGIPTIYLVGRAPHSSRAATMVACATGADPQQVLAKVLREVIAYRIALHVDHEVPSDVDDFRDVLDGAHWMGRPERADAFDFLLSSTRRTRLSDMPVLARGDAARDPDLVVEQLRRRGMEAVAVDVTTDEARDVGFHAVRVFVPQLVPLSFHQDGRYLGHPRLLDAPERLGYPERVGTDINPMPQPFA